MSVENILVIKHGSLGDWIQATGAFKLIRTRYPNANIIMLTQPHYLALAHGCTWFNQVFLDSRLPLYKLISNLKVIKKLCSYNYDHVYDLQCSNRTNIYYKLIHKKVKNWYGRATGCSHYVAFAENAHSLELSRDIIKASGITDLPTPDITWLKTQKFREKIKSLGQFVVFIPGSSAKHSAKRWLAERYAQVIDWLNEKKIKSVLIGTEIDRNIIDRIIAKCKTSPINLINKAHFAETAELARLSSLVIGSDTGPMHIAGATNTTTLVLFTGASNPEKSKPWGINIHVLTANNAKLITTNTVIAKITMLLNL